MTLPLPQLDNQTFDELIADARKLIPRYAPEWTDYNIHDPGITFIELFAWLTELQRYYLDRVRDENYLKFLKLLGITLKDARSASTDVTFSYVDPQMLTPIVVPEGTRLKTREQIDFATDCSLLLIPAQISQIIRSSATGLQENLERDLIQGLSFYGFGEDAAVGNSLSLGFKPIKLFDWDKVPSCEENADTERLKQYLVRYLNIDWIKNTGDRHIYKLDQGRTIVIAREEDELVLELDRFKRQVKVTGSGISKPAYFFIKEKEDKLIIYASPFPVNKIIPLTFNLFENYPIPKGKHREEPVEFVPSVVLRWSYYSTVGGWRSLEIDQDETQMLYQSGRVWFRVPINLQTRNIFPFAEQLYWLRVTVDTAGYELPPKINSITLNTISASGVDTLAATITYSSNGKCWQSFPTSYLAIKGDNILQVKMSESDWKAKLGRELSPEEIRELVENEYWQDWQDYEIDKTEIREKIAIAFKEAIPTIGKNNVRVISVSELADFCSLFRSNGLPYQTFSLKQFPIAITSFQIQIREEIENNYYWRDWIRVEDFDASESRDTHYILDPQKGEICFGDGVNGKIPPSDNKDNIRVISCQLVRGELGNVEANAIDEIYEPVSGLLDKEFVTIKNYCAASGGTSHESLATAKRRMRRELKIVDRTITERDFERLAINTPGLRVAKAKALLPTQDKLSSLVKVVVVPYSETAIPTQPSEGFLKAVGQHLNKHRLITTQIKAIKPYFVEVSVKAVVRIYPKYNPERTRQKIKDFLTQQFLNPLTGGDQGKGWSFGRTVYRSEVYQAITNSTEAVDCVKDLKLIIVNPSENIKVNRAGNIPLVPHSLVYSTKHQIEIEP